jgi:hypothetical protein
MKPSVSWDVTSCGQMVINLSRELKATLKMATVCFFETVITRLQGVIPKKIAVETSNVI